MGGKQEVVWQYKKVSADNPEKKLQEFLDAQQYTRKGILKYEKVFGHRYVSTGGEQTTMEFCQLFNLERGQKVLDVGCGIGGSAFYMAQVNENILGIIFGFFFIQLVFEFSSFRNMVFKCMAWTCLPT